MSRSRVTEKDMGWNRIKREMRKTRGSGVNVGVLSDSGKRSEFPADNPGSGDGGDADMLLVAAANEFGTADGHIPARPFIRGAYDDQANKIKLRSITTRLWNQVLAGRLSLKQALGLLGEEHQGQVQEYMTALSSPANSPRTVAQKRGGTNPLIDEGRLRNAIRWEYDE